MNIVDFIGFIIALVALFLMYIRRRAEIRKMQHEEKQEFFPAPQPKPTYAAQLPPKTKAKPAPPMQKKKEPVVKAHDAYAIVQTNKTPRGIILMSQLKSRRDMFLYKEIFDKPLSLRPPDDLVK